MHKYNYFEHCCLLNPRFDEIMGTLCSIEGKRRCSSQNLQNIAQNRAEIAYSENKPHQGRDRAAGTGISIPIVVARKSMQK
jgi:hypothetical protein